LNKIVCIHQPNYLPWIGLFSKIKRSNCFILYDVVQYTTHGVINRNKIRTKTGFGYLTIPIPRASHKEPILNVPLPGNNRWQKDHWQTIQTNYAKTPFFRLFKDFFEQIYREEFQYLWQLNERIIRYLLDCLGVKVEICRASQLDLDMNLTKTDLILDCLKKVSGDLYLSGPSGSNYREEEKFETNQIGLRYFQFKHPVYPQRYPGFEPNLSAIDLLFNTGPEASQIVQSSGAIV
jgi:hypothetical protein